MNLPDDFRSPAFKRGVKDAKHGRFPQEATPEYLKGYDSEYHILEIKKDQLQQNLNLGIS